MLIINIRPIPQRYITFGICVLGILAILSLNPDPADARVSLTQLQNRIADLEADLDHVKDTLYGTVIMWSGAIDLNGNPLISGVPDENWQICNGTKGTPDLRGRFMLGASNPAGGPPLLPAVIPAGPGTVDGQRSYVLSVNHLPAHRHTVNIDTDEEGRHSHMYYDGWYRNSYKYIYEGTFLGDEEKVAKSDGGTGTSRYTETEQDHFHEVEGDTGHTGGGMALDVTPPYYALVFLMYIGQ